VPRLKAVFIIQVSVVPLPPGVVAARRRGPQSVSFYSKPCAIVHYCYFASFPDGDLRHVRISDE
jgi:hypothetical protein